MSFVMWIIVGLVAGLAGKAIMPGTKNEPAGWLGTILLGIAGSVLGGFLGSSLLGARSGGGMMGLLLSIVGACLLIGLMRLLTGNRRG